MALPRHRKMFVKSKVGKTFLEFCISSEELPFLSEVEVGVVVNLAFGTGVVARVIVDSGVVLNTSVNSGVVLVVKYLIHSK